MVHRLDKETSGLVLVAKNKKSEAILKNMFQTREIKKEYLAIVEGRVGQSFLIDEPLKVGLETSIIKIKVFINSQGKEAKTLIEPIRYNSKNDTTLIKATPLTGRQHQIRVHLFHVKHRIVGDPIYGVDEIDADRYLGKKMSQEERIKKSGADRLMLHAYRLVFEYKGEKFEIESEGLGFRK